MSPFYTITENMWQNHALTPPFHKPYHEFDPQQQAMQYFDGLRDVKEEALCFKEAQRNVSFHDSILRYKRGRLLKLWQRLGKWHNLPGR